MRLHRLIVSDFRNLEPCDLAFDRPYVVLHGRNAQGKTNALEAIWLLATLKPLRGRRVREVVGWGRTDAVVVGDVEKDRLVRRHRVEIGEGRRRVELDGKSVPLDQYFAGIRAIAFTPADLGIVGGEPVRRRAWLDRAAFTASPAHLDAVRTFRRILDQKAAALRQGSPDAAVLDALDEHLASEGARLVSRRMALLDELRPHVEELHASIAEQGGRLTLRYRTAVEGTDLVTRTADLRRKLAEARRREVDRKQPLVGPQTDDVELAIDGRSARAYGSQGQVRTTVLALKLAELVAARRRGEVPLFLVDDVGSELDRDRKRRLVTVLGELGTQVFATTTDPDHLAELPRDATAWFEVSGGRISRIPTA